MVKYVHPRTGGYIMAPTGFSGTTFFFGWFVALWRGDIRGCAFQLITAVFTLGFSNLIWCFVYNQFYMDQLESKGWIRQDRHVDSPFEYARIPSDQKQSEMATSAVGSVYYDVESLRKDINPLDDRNASTLGMVNLLQNNVDTTHAQPTVIEPEVIRPPANILGRAGGFGRKAA